MATTTAKLDPATCPRNVPAKLDPTTCPSNAPSKSLLSASAEGAKFLILLQVSSRLLTFAVNQLLLRYLSPALLGLSVQLELLTISILYFSRESLRNALQRQASGAQSVVNMSLLALPLGIVFSAALAWVYVRSAPPAVAALPWFRESVALYVLATMLELASEPGFAVAQMRLRYKLRAGAESSAAFVRCVLTCAGTVWAAGRGIEVGPLPFAVGQLGYGAVLLAVYGVETARVARKEGFAVGLRRIGAEKECHAGLFDKHLSSLAATMWVQSSLKYVLTQGDSLLVAWLTTLQDQGVYALAANYGSLIARMLFQPLEESARNLFSKLLSGDPSPASLASAATILKTVTKLYVLLSIFFVALGPPFAPIALQLVAGSRWADAGQVLACFCYYIPVLAVNGITESFVQSVATPRQLRAQSAWMFAFSVAFAAAGYGFVAAAGLGAQGLVWANVVNMVLRIVWSSVFVGRYFAERGVVVGWGETRPEAGLVGVAAVVGAVVRGKAGVRLVEELGLVRQLGLGVAAGVVLAAGCGVFERRFLRQCWRMARSEE